MNQDDPTIPRDAGPPLASAPPVEAASPLDAFVPTNPLAALSCWLGVASLLFCLPGPVLGPIAIVLGVLALRTWKAKESAYGKATSAIRAWIGIVTGSAALLLGAAVLWLLLFSA